MYLWISETAQSNNNNNSTSGNLFKETIPNKAFTLCTKMLIENYKKMGKSK